MSRTLWPLAALATFAVIAAGCGSRSAGTRTSTAASGGNGTSIAHAKSVKFAECMRTHGVSGFPDPTATGALTIDAVVNGSSLDTDGAVWKQAIGACKNLEPSGFTGTDASPEKQKERLKFARCIRDNGVPDFPDPTASEPLIDTNRIPSAATPGGMSALHAAMRECSGFARAAGVTGGP
jgi:hypothetical protein